MPLEFQWATALACPVLSAAPAAAPNVPTKPIQRAAAFASGGSTDLLARVADVQPE